MMKQRLFIKKSSYRVVVAVAFFCLWSFIACSSPNADPATQPTLVDSDAFEEEPAIHQFIASAPNKAAVAQQVTPTQVRLPVEGELPLPEVDPFLAAGDLRITGSPTLTGLTQAIYRRFVTAGYNGTIKIEEVGTTPGFQRYCGTGEVDLMLAERPIQESELRLCMQHGRQPVALLISLNAIVVVVNPNNSLLDNTSIEDLKQIFTDVYWSDVKTDWPIKKIFRFLPETDFGAFTYFSNLVLAGESARLQKAPFTQLLSDQSEIAQEVSNNNDAVAFLDYPYYRTSQDLLKALAVNGIKPEAESIEQKRYPLINPLLIYTDPQTLQTKPQLGTFLLFYLTYLNKELDGAGNFAVDVDTLNRSKILLLLAMGNELYVNELSKTVVATPKASSKP